MDYFTYILHSDSADRYYIGYTNNLEIRLRQHNNNYFGFTKRYRPWKIVYSKSFSDKKSAMKLERYLKSLKNKERIKQFIAG